MVPAKILALGTFLAALASAAGPCRLDGRIVDPSGAPVPGAAVSLMSASQVTLASSESKPSGEFAFSALACGNYVLAASRAGFADRRLPLRLQASNATNLLVVQLSLVPVEEQITVTADASEVESTGRVVQRVNSIPRSTLAERAHTVLTEVAAGEPGVHEQRTAPAMGSFFVRGLSGKNVAVYRDGFRYTTSAQRGGVSTFQNLTDPALLDSVEILRGPNSAQYGSDSIGGTVNLLSSFPLQLNRRFSGELAPAFDTASAMFGTNALLGLSAGRLSLTTALAGRRVNTVRTAHNLDGHAAVTRFLGLPSDIVGGDRQPDTAFTQYGGSLHSQYRITPLQHLVFHYERSQQDGVKRYDQLLGGDGNLIADLRNLMLDFGYLRWQRFQTGFLDQVSIGASYNAQREERVNQGGQGNPRAAITHQYERLAAWGLTALTEKRVSTHHLTTGGEGYLERMAAPAFTFNPVNGTTVLSRPRIPDGARYISHGLYVQDVWQPVSRVRVSGGLRFGGASYQSQHSDPPDSLAANSLTGRIGGTLRIVEPVSVYANYSRGFRAPNMTDLGTLGVQGNGNFEASVNALTGRNAIIGSRADDQAVATGRAVERLRPETSDNFDAGVQVQHSRLRADFTAFWMNLGNSIVSQTLILPQGAVGQPLGDQIITRQLASGAVFVPSATNAVLVRANYYGARVKGIEHSLRLRLTNRLTLNENVTWIEARDERTGLPPDIEPGIPPLTFNPSVLYTAHRYWFEAYSTIAGRQERLSSLALADRRIGAARSRANIASFFSNGATARGLVSGGRLLATNETVEQVQTRVLGTATSAPLFTAVPGYGLIGLRAGVPLGEQTDLFFDFSNIADKSHRGIGWGIDGTGRSLTVRWRMRF